MNTTKYYDISERGAYLRPVSIIIGGRGIGKTYSCLKYAIESGRPFLYLRNTDTQMAESASVFGNPFKRISLDMDRDIRLEKEGKHYVINEYTEGQNCIGYGAALSTFSNLRGVDLSDVELVVFDEFIERRKLNFRQFDAFMGMYETINRNREAQGRPPLMVICLSNSQTLQNPILQGLQITEVIIDMIRKNEQRRVLDNLFIELPTAGITEEKKNAAIYKLAAGSGAAREALENEFVYDSFRQVVKKPVNEYLPVCTVYTDLGAIVYYKHKSRPEYYGCSVPAWSAKRYEKEDYMQFMKDYGLKLQSAEIRQRIYYENYTMKTISENLLKLT